MVARITTVTGMLVGTPRPTRSRAAPSSAAPKASRAAGGTPLGAGLCHHQSAREADQREGDARRADPLAQKKGRAEDQDQRPRLENGYHIGNRHASKSHDIAEGAERLPGCPQQRARVEDAGNTAPVPPQGNDDRAGETCRDAAQEEHLERRKVLGDQLHEAIPDHEERGRGKHGGDAAQIGTSVHGRSVDQGTRYCQKHDDGHYR